MLINTYLVLKYMAKYKPLVEINENFKGMNTVEATEILKLMNGEIKIRLYKAGIDVASVIANGCGGGDWVARIRLVDNVYIESFPKYDGIGIGLSPEYDFNTNSPVNQTNRKIIKHVAFKIKRDDVFVYNGENHTLESGDSLSELCEKLGLAYEDWDDLENIDPSQYPIFSSVKYIDFSQRLTALKAILKENNCFGYTEYKINFR